MTQSTTILDQILNLVPKKLFENLADTYLIDKNASVFHGKTHFAVLMLAQLTGLSSLRDIVNATSSLNSLQQKGGLKSVKRSTLSDANKRINNKFYYELFQSLLAIYGRTLPRHRFTLPGKLFSIDSTTISLCLSNFPWAEYRQNSAAIKLHTLLDNDGYIPADIIMTDGKVHDIRPGREFKIHSGSTYLLDRGYFDRTLLLKIKDNGAFFVTRWKKGPEFVGTKTFESKSKTGVKGRWIGKLKYTNCKEEINNLCLVRYIDPESNKEFWFLTNLMDVDSQTIADLYKHRWQIEIFFKWIKQNLKIKTFLGRTPNAVLTQIWIAMIAYLLLKVTRNRSNSKITSHQLLVFISVNIFRNIHINKAWQDFQRTKRKKKENQIYKTRKLLK